MGEVYQFFTGIGALAVFLVLAYLFYQISRFWKQIADKEAVYIDAEVVAVINAAKKAGIDVDSYFNEQQAQRNPTFKKKLQEQAIKDYFDK